MIWVAPIDSGGKPVPALVFEFHRWGMLQVQVKGPGSVLIATTREELQNTQTIPSGLEIKNSDPIIELHWHGQLWAIGSSPGAAMDLQVQELTGGFIL